MKLTYAIIITSLTAICFTYAAPVFTFTELDTDRYSVTLNEDINFTITSAPTLEGIGLIWDGAGANSTERTDVSVTGSISLNYRSESYAIDVWADNVGAVFNEVTADDAFIYSQSQLNSGSTIAIDDVVTLTAGTLTMTAANSSFQPPLNGSYDFFLSDGNGVKLTDTYSTGSIPEPSTISLAVVVSGSILFMRRRFII